MRIGSFVYVESDGLVTVIRDSPTGRRRVGRFDAETSEHMTRANGSPFEDGNPFDHLDKQALKVARARWRLARVPR